MDTAVSSRTVMAALYRAFESLCNGSWSAVRVACVPNGQENRFMVHIEAEWRNAVYSYLAEHSAVRIPPDGSALNLSAEEAIELGAMQDAAATPQAPRTPRRLSTDLRGELLQHTLQP
jgi:hypothetical protein